MLAGGTESMSMIPMGGNKISPNPWLVDHYPDAYLSMGLTAERVAQPLRHQPRASDEFSLPATESPGRAWPPANSKTKWSPCR